jgi:hypothetical protein
LIFGAPECFDRGERQREEDDVSLDASLIVPATIASPSSWTSGASVSAPLRLAIVTLTPARLNWRARAPPIFPEPMTEYVMMELLLIGSHSRRQA